MAAECLDRFRRFHGVKSSIWAGPDKHAVVYFLRGGGLLNFVACVELDSGSRILFSQTSLVGAKADFDGWHEDNPRSLMRRAGTILCLGTECLSALGNWSTSRATLIGDAVHPTFPLAQGAGMAVEDAAILTRALGGPRLSLTRFSFINETGFSGPGGLFGKPTEPRFV